MARSKHKTCLRKKRYETEIEAHQPGQQSYHCLFCQGWHRSSYLPRNPVGLPAKAVINIEKIDRASRLFHKKKHKQKGE